MDKRIVFKNPDGSCGIVIPSPHWKGTLEELAKKDVPKGYSWRITDVSKLPQSRNWRGAWTDDDGTDTVDIDLEKTKIVHKQLIIKKARERVECDGFGQKDFSGIKSEIDALDFDGIKTLNDLYNLWPESINERKQKRQYKTYG